MSTFTSRAARLQVHVYILRLPEFFRIRALLPKLLQQAIPHLSQKRHGGSKMMMMGCAVLQTARAAAVASSTGTSCWEGSAARWRRATAAAPVSSWSASRHKERLTFDNGIAGCELLFRIKTKQITGRGKESTCLICWKFSTPMRYLQHHVTRLTGRGGSGRTL